MVNVYPYLKVVSIVLVLILLWVWIVYNSLVKKRNQLKTDLSDVNIQIKQKLELVDKLVAMVREYSTHEKQTFENVTKARSALDTSKSASDSTKADNFLAQTLKSLMVVVESYPKLQASKNYQDLTTDLKDIEGKIASYREEYNLSVQNYNNSIQTFPNLLVASLLGFREEQLFEISTS
jgi:LemA protein